MQMLGQLLRLAVSGESYFSIKLLALKTAPQNKHQSYQLTPWHMDS